MAEAGVAPSALRPSGCEDCELLFLVAYESWPLAAGTGAKLFCYRAFSSLDRELPYWEPIYFLPRLIVLEPPPVPTVTILAPEKLVIFGLRVVAFDSVCAPPSLRE